MKAGFTLLEMLVVLVLIGLMSTLLLQGFAYVLYLRSHFLVQLEDSQQGALKEYWFRSTVAGIVTDYQDGEHLFKGEPRQFSGLTIATLDNMAGVPTSFTWQLEYSAGITKLNYQTSQGEVWEVARWNGDHGTFSYMAVDGKWSDRWPPPFGTAPPQIPRMIALQGQRRQTPFTWLVKLAEHDYGRWKPDDM
jgi:general secretion pathway protein J